jgi:FkbM family methyltransferase
MQLASTNVRVFDRPYQVFGFPEEGWFNILASSGEYKEFNLDHLRQFINRDSVCLDIGANMGLMSLAMAVLAPEGEVYAFEASETTHDALRKTVEASGLHNIQTFPWIMGKDGMKGRFVEDEQWRSSSHYIPGEGGRVCKSVDSLGLPMVDFIKIDVEGAELDVLDGARETLSRFKPTVTLEFNSFAFVHYRDIIPRHALKKICSIFPNVGYFENRVGRIIELSDHEAFLQHNMFNGFVDDLICFWE